MKQKYFSDNVFIFIYKFHNGGGGVLKGGKMSIPFDSGFLHFTILILRELMTPIFPQRKLVYIKGSFDSASLTF